MFKIMCFIVAFIMLSACTGGGTAVYARAEQPSGMTEPTGAAESTDAAEPTGVVESPGAAESTDAAEATDAAEPIGMVESPGAAESPDASKTGDMPGLAAIESAAAVVAMHDSVMRDVLGIDYSFAGVAGAGDIYVLFSGGDEGNFLMVAFDETGERAATGVVQAYSEDAFTGFSLNSLRALFLPFCPEDGRSAFEDWLADAAYDAVTCARAGEDMELDYFYSDYASCAVGVYHDDGKPLFTALTDWYSPLSADDIHSLMGGYTDEP